MSFFKRLFGLESKEERLERQLNDKKSAIIKILKKYANDDPAFLSTLQQFESQNKTFTELSKTIDDILATNALTEDDKQNIAQEQEETKQILEEEKNNLINDVENPEIVDTIPKTNSELLSEITNNLDSMIVNIGENNSKIALMENKLNELKRETADINQLIDELREKLKATDDLKEKTGIIAKIQALEESKKDINRRSANIQEKIRQIQELVKVQSQHLANYQTGTGKKSPFAKITKMKRADLNKMAESNGLNPKSYGTKKDIQDALKLVTLAKKLPLKKMDKGRLAVISKNFGIPTKSRHGMLGGLKKYKIIK